ncbi:hypothetical protein FM113_13835 [Leucobacter sp. 7(1)]|uniref:DUF4238 domain-containing protein n=1 Tax=Leucobacter sp. 7(1) TaxID=1255613 RepID=UPI00097F5253|nr:DUF4238 domain-containing protein [Leucobacter sp. 7(1)]SJN12085.1 hypothetical protein FM113_13835 [Leucobacter sp. 7(1)]
MSGKPKRHHTVPKFYLEGFAGGKMLHAVNIRDGSEHNANVVNATAESHFYRVQDHPTDPGAFEAALSEAEGVATGILRSISEGSWPLSVSDRYAFAQFMTLQFLRVQSHRRQMHHAIAAILRELATDDPAELERILSLPGAPEGVDFANGEVPALVSSAVHIRQISTLVPALVGHLLDRPWELVKFDQPSLITSDEPLTPIPNPRESQNVGLGLENSWALLFPLTRELALVMFRTPIPLRLTPVDQEVVEGHFDFSREGDPVSLQAFNVNTVMHAFRFVFHHPADAHLMPANAIGLAKRGGRINLDDLPEDLRPTP